MKIVRKFWETCTPAGKTITEGAAGAALILFLLQIVMKGHP